MLSAWVARVPEDQSQLGEARFHGICKSISIALLSHRQPAIFSIEAGAILAVLSSRLPGQAMKSSKLPNIKKFSSAKQRRLDELLAKNSSGAILPHEQERLVILVNEAEELMVANAKLLADFARSQSPAAPPQAVPVTVWVNPDLAEH